MRVVLDINDGLDGRLDGTVSWAGAPDALPFTGVLELVGILEAAINNEDGTSPVDPNT